MDWNHYRFHSVWDLPAPPDAVFAVLADAHTYPLWWHQVRDVRVLDELTGTARFRSLLPYDLFVTGRQQRNEPDTGILQVGMAGDLEGWARWQITPGRRGGDTRAVYDQEVEVTKPLLRRLAVPCRPALRLNHALMMRSGRRGLTALLAGGARRRTR